jgi:hypothetical protein
LQRYAFFGNDLRKKMKKSEKFLKNGEKSVKNGLLRPPGSQ